MKKANENIVPLDFSPIEEQCRQLSENYRVSIPSLRSLDQLLSSSKSINKHRIGKVNFSSIPLSGEISITVSNIFKIGSIMLKKSSMKSTMITRISSLNTRTSFKISTMKFFSVLLKPVEISYTFVIAMNNEIFKPRSILLKLNGKSSLVPHPFVYFDYNSDELNRLLSKN